MKHTQYEDWIVNRWKITRPYALRSQQVAVAGLGLGGEAGETQEHIKKLLRDGHKLGEAFLLEAGDTLHYLTVLLNNAGYSLTDAMLANIDKLEARVAAGAPMRASNNTMPGASR